MPKGRVFAPATEREGVWFPHGKSSPGYADRRTVTSTGAMLVAPFAENHDSHPAGWSKVSRYHNYRDTNDFSAHDNRNSFQGHGVYFGDGRDTRSLGKRLRDNDTRQHHTDNEYLKHDGRVVVDKEYNTQYSVSFKGERNTPAERKRFPKIHREPSAGPARLNTTTVSQYRDSDVPFKTPLHVLAVSQEPFLDHNAWKFSYHGRSKCYPPYNVTEGPGSVFSPIAEPHTLIRQ